MARRFARGDDRIRSRAGRLRARKAGLRRTDGQAASHGDADVRRDHRCDRRLSPFPRLRADARADRDHPRHDRHDDPPHATDGRGAGVALRKVVAKGVVGIARLLAGGNVRRVGFTPDERQRIYFANHASHLDFVLIWAALPPRLRAMTRPVAAKDYWDKTGLRRYLGVKVFNAVLVDRQPAATSSADRAMQQQPTAAEAHGGGSSAIDVLLEGLGDKHSLILFPEGTRGDGT